MNAATVTAAPPIMHASMEIPLTLTPALTDSFAGVIAAPSLPEVSSALNFNSLYFVTTPSLPSSAAQLVVDVAVAVTSPLTAVGVAKCALHNRSGNWDAQR